MKIEDIYRRYTIPPNLQEHMLRVAGVIEIIHQHWIGKEKVDWDFAIKTALLHDLGNLVKFDLTRYPNFLGRKKNLNYWQNKQKEFIKKYSNNDKAATQKILGEIGLNQKIDRVISFVAFNNSVLINNSSDWTMKLLLYSDLRVLPTRVGSLQERYSDARIRYSDNISKHITNFEKLADACLEIEIEIGHNLDIPVTDINDRSVNLLIPGKLMGVTV